MSAEKQNSVIKPMPLWQSTLLFTIPGIIFALLYVYLFDYLMSAGVSHMRSMITVSFVALGLIFVLAMVLYRREGNVFTIRRFMERMRIRRMDGRAWLYTVLGLIFNVSTYVGLLFTAKWFAGQFDLPTWALLPKEAEPVVAAYGLLLFRFLLLLLNVFGEEFLWRGYILPRQELQHGKHAWWIHGLQWTWFHILFKPWEIFMLLPGCLAYGWICSKTRNTTPGIIMHLGLNGIGVLMLALAVFGVTQ
jgi:membrane protease YdiL (CAAX protease family)